MDSRQGCLRPFWFHDDQWGGDWHVLPMAPLSQRRLSYYTMEEKPFFFKEQLTSTSRSSTPFNHPLDVGDRHLKLLFGELLAVSFPFLTDLFCCSTRSGLPNQDAPFDSPNILHHHLEKLISQFFFTCIDPSNGHSLNQIISICLLLCFFFLFYPFIYIHGTIPQRSAQPRAHIEQHQTFQSYMQNFFYCRTLSPKASRICISR
jgi:hypothetical protein